VLHSSAQSYICARSDSYVEGFAGKAGAEQEQATLGPQLDPSLGMTVRSGPREADSLACGKASEEGRIVQRQGD